MKIVAAAALVLAATVYVFTMAARHHNSWVLSRIVQECETQW